jgi:hypothetical protein
MLFTLSYSNLPASRTTVAAWENRVPVSPAIERGVVQAEPAISAESTREWVSRMCWPRVTKCLLDVDTRVSLNVRGGFKP